MVNPQLAFVKEFACEVFA